MAWEPEIVNRYRLVTPDGRHRMRRICTLQSNGKDLSAACGAGARTRPGSSAHIFTPLVSLRPGVPPPAQDPESCSENLGLVIKGQAEEPGRPVFKFRICTLIRCGAFCKLLALSEPLLPSL